MSEPHEGGGRRGRRGRYAVTLNLASMIDLTFLLLIYFMVTTILAQPEDRLSPTLQTRSESAMGAQADFAPQIVDVLRGDGIPAFQLGTELYHDRPTLTKALVKLHRPAGLFVRGSGRVPVASIAAALQAGRDAGFDQVTYVPSTK